MDAHTWLESLPPDLAAQRDVLARLLAAVERDPRWRWLEIGCSIAEGRGDALSDLDLGLGVADDAWDEALADLPALLGSLGEVVGSLHHRLSGMGDRPHQRVFVQYAGGVQIDLVAMLAEDDLLRAATACARLLTATSSEAASRVGASLPTSFAAHVCRQLEDLRPVSQDRS